MYNVLPFYRKSYEMESSESNIIIIIQSLISCKNTQCKYKFQEIIYSCIMLTVIRVSCFNVDFIFFCSSNRHDLYDCTSSASFSIDSVAENCSFCSCGFMLCAIELGRSSYLLI